MTRRAGQRSAWAAGLLLSSVWALSAAAPVVGQLSPGLLSEPHAHLEGTAHCQDCHESRKGVDPQKCLACHELLAARIRAGDGLHAREEYSDCKSCHIDHHGLEFELVWWGEDGIEAFDHHLTGFHLVAAHGALDCRECHRADLLLDEAALTARGKEPGRTFLGLGTECLACHSDEHRGQLSGQPCLACHSQQSWSPAPGFDHQETRYPLTGLHVGVDCGECHDLQEDRAGGETFRQFTGLAYSSCADCHDDPHRTRFGPACSECHVTSGWLRVDDRRFDHDLTRYPLTGRHRRVECVDCHPAGESRSGLAFDRCTDCHRDVHLGQLADRADGTACESCHTIEGFSPALFATSEHQAVWALEGAHLAVACDACHRMVEPVELIRVGVASPGGETTAEPTVQLRFASTRCLDCHPDPHSLAEEAAGAAECTSCHLVDSWRTVTFDHGATDFELVGGHLGQACSACHVTADNGSLEFDGLGTACAACHSDPHAGQLVDDSGATACERCHSEEIWRPAQRFDHDRDTAFRLDGAHRDVACLSCHPTESVDGVPVVRYKPVDPRCTACHATDETN